MDLNTDPIEIDLEGHDHRDFVLLLCPDETCGTYFLMEEYDAWTVCEGHVFCPVCGSGFDLPKED